jgi:C4-dicarboxylate-binding protein DctP
MVAAVMMAMASAAVLPGTVAAASPDLVISTENTASHSQTRTLEAFAARLNDRLAGRLSVAVKSGAALFRDREVTEALSAGRVAMAAPGIWHLSRFVPDFDILQLPMVYGRPAAAIAALVDGDLGRALDDQLEQRFNVHVIGRWLDLGHGHLFTTDRPLTEVGDIGGLRIRVAGGAANRWRIKHLGAEPVVISWPDFPHALRDGLADGTLTTATTVASAALWEHGLTHAYLDQEYYPYYVPLISGAIWARLSPAMREAVTAAWEDVVDDGRRLAVTQQEEAISLLERHGMTVVRPDAATLARTRADLMAAQDDLVAELGLTPALVDQTRRHLDSGREETP